MESGAGLSRKAAQEFAERYATASSEKSLGQSFWRDFLAGVCGVSDLLATGVEFEYPVRSATTGTVGFIDVLWPNVLLVEHKSAGQDLDKAEKQARDYLISLPPALRPPTLIVCDFQRFRVIEVLAGTSVEFPLVDLADHVARFAAIRDARGRGAAQVEVAADAHAADLMSRLYVAFEDAGYQGHAVSVFLVRCLFLLFGDDTQMWMRPDNVGLFESLVAESPESGAGLGGTIQELFQVLNQPREERPKSLSPSVADFPYVNGGLFAETLPVFSFTPEMRGALLAACRYAWSGISPAIFGAMFQNIRSREARRELGQHFTSETNILKVIGPLFLAEFNERLAREWDSPSGLRRLKKELGTYNFLDPACGCGNFLLVAYKKMREFDLRLTARLLELERSTTEALIGTMSLSLSLSQFHGIEYDEWSSQIARVALLLAEHQENVAMERLLGSAPSMLPLSDAASITHGNALRLDWSSLVPMNERTLIMGNPPFAGSSLQSEEQRQDTALVWGGLRGSGMLDYVANWFRVAGEHCASGARVAFVSTNSITQGDQPPIIWGQLYPRGIGIDFAHRTFGWSNESSGQAAVHTVIIGFSGRLKPAVRPLWNYVDVRGEPALILARNINAYLLDAPDVLVTARRRPLVSWLQPMEYGNKPVDDGLLSNISPADAERIREKDPVAAKYLRRTIGARELINGAERWCLWLPNASPSDVRGSQELASRVAAVRDLRAKSAKAMTRESAERPTQYQEMRQPKTDYLAVPRHSSENRDYLPVGRFGPEVIPNDALFIIGDPSLVTFGLISSKVFWLWAAAVSGRLESRIRVSNTITWNNFPVPAFTPFEHEAIEAAANGVLIARSHFLSSTLADLYDANAMPPPLRRAHAQLDRAVLTAFGLPLDADDEHVLARLFTLYSEMSGGMFPDPEARPRSRSRRAA